MNYYGKQQCLDMDWSNVKDIHNDEIAYCIHTHDIDIDMVPDARLDIVNNELAKLRNRDKEDKERKAIESILAIYECISTTTSFFGEVANYSDEVVDHYLNPDLFTTAEEASMAMNELNYMWNHEMTKTEEYNHKYKDNNHSRDTKRLRESMEQVKQQYVKLGGIEADCNKAISQIPEPQKGTLKQDLDAAREFIQQHFINIGTSATRAKKIAIAITSEAEQALK